MLELDSSSMKLKIKPISYPVMEISLENGSEHEDDFLETEVTFPMEFWSSLALTLKGGAKDMGAFGSKRIISELQRMSQRILAEIEAENRRLKFKETYESFTNFVVQINSRTDLDDVRKGQIIHDMAHKLKLEA
jgi:regulatory protein YycI of two-component signal transduction system YycFG